MLKLKKAMNPILLLVKGHPGVGKSTLARYCAQVSDCSQNSNSL
jgi:2-phosphoglycerate kinase